MDSINDFSYIKYKNISFVGTSDKTQKAISFLTSYVDLRHIYSDDAADWGGYFQGIEILKFDPSIIQENEILILCDEDWYLYASRMIACEKKPFESFILYDLIKPGIVSAGKLLSFLDSVHSDIESFCRFVKKEAFVGVGYCHIDNIVNMISLDREFANKYVILNIPRIQMYVYRDYIESGYNSNGFSESYSSAFRLYHRKDFWNAVDVIMYEDVTEKSTRERNLLDFCLLNKNNNCRVIKIPTLNFAGYFPGRIKKDPAIYNLRYNFMYTDVNIEKMIDDRCSCNYIVKSLMDENFYSRKQVIRWIESSIKLIEYRERFCDVKIADYIKLNYGKFQLFSSPSHPTMYFMCKVANQVLDFLFPHLTHDLNDLYDMEHIIRIDGSLNPVGADDCLVYPSVINHLRLTNYFKCYYVNIYSEIKQVLSPEEYISEYIRLSIRDRSHKYAR